MAGDCIGEIAPDLDRSANFRWGGDENEMVAGLCAAAVLSKLVNGVVLDQEEGRLLSVEQAIALARNHLGAVKPPEKPRWGTRPADIKRYLKPLLRERSDLALVGRLLIVRPVLHLLRGAYFEGDGAGRFRIWSHVNPLYAPAGSSFGDYWHVHGTEVWQPHFLPLLYDSLAEDVFNQMGLIATLEDFTALTFDRPPLFDTRGFLAPKS